MQGANMEEIIKMAQKVATNIAENQTESINPQNMDMSKVISQVTQSVSQMITPDMIEKMSGASINSMNNNTSNLEKTVNPNFKSKINFDEESNNKSKKVSKVNKSSSSIEELEESDSE